MRILAIETSCDETGISIVEIKGGTKKPEFKVLTNITSSQASLHAKYGGVFPMMAKREHARTLIPLFRSALLEAKLLKKVKPKKYPEILGKLEIIFKKEPELLAHFLKFVPKINIPPIDAIAVTKGPGLEPALWVGINFAKALSLFWKKPIVPVNHMEGHIFASLFSKDRIPEIKFPSLALLISGGHTELVLFKKWFDYKIIGETRDDAVGEAFDKVARILGLPYPGGPEIERVAKKGVAGVYPLPRPMLKSNDLDFSFSGLKTAVLYLSRKLGKIDDKIRADIAREFEESATEVLVEKTSKALKKYGAKTLIIGGGVAANERIRNSLSSLVETDFPKTKIYLPHKSLTTDNGLMIALAGALRFARKKAESGLNLRAEGNLKLGKKV